MVWWRSRIECDDWLVVLCSQSNLKHWMYLRILDSLSIVLWIATCWWCIGRGGSSVIECWCCNVTVVGGVPTLQVGEWLVCELIPVVGGHLDLGVVLLDVVGRLTEE